MESLRSASETLVFYEAPHRILEMLADVGKVLGEKRKIVVARELTKIHEEFLRGTATEISAELSQRPAVKGEMTVIVSGEVKGEAGAATEGNLVDRMRQLMASESLDEKAALKQVAKEFGLSKSEAYREWQRRKRQSAISNRQ